MTQRSTSVTDNKPSSIDRPTAIGIGAIIVAILVLTALIAGITLLPAQTISQSISTLQIQQQTLQVNTVSAQMSAYFTDLTNEMLSLADRPEIQTADAEQLIEDTATRLHGQIKAIALFKSDGALYYKYPVNKLLDWDSGKTWVQNFIDVGGFQYQRLPAKNTYLLIKPISFAVVNGGIAQINISGVLAFELDLNTYFTTTFNKLNLSGTSQLWVFDNTTGTDPISLYSTQSQAFSDNLGPLEYFTETKTLQNYPSADRESTIGLVTTPFRNRLAPLTFAVALSQPIGETPQNTVGLLQTLFLVGLFTVAVLVIAGFLIGRFLLGASRRRRVEDQRRSTARLLLEIARALNSSLDLNVVLQQILRELGKLLPHDSANIMLLDEENQSVVIAAETGGDSISDSMGKTILLSQLRGAQAVIKSGRPIVINDTANDPRWNLNSTTQQIQAWLGVPMRLRNESVGILNINSHAANRFLPDDIDFAEAFADQSAVAIQNARAHELEIRVFEQELETARAIQNSLLPQEVPPVSQLDIAARNIAARHVSGDYYQYFMLPDGKLGVAIGDVSGKGIPAALLMAVVTTALRDEILRTPSPALLLNELNIRLLARMKQNNMNSALMVALFDPVTRHVEIANGGMVEPYVYNGQAWEAIPVGGYPLGASARMSYNSKVATLAPGSILLMISDGVVESQNKQGQFFGFEALDALLASLPSQITADELADHILSAVRTHLEGQEPQDDITVVVMKSIDQKA